MKKKGNTSFEYTSKPSTFCIRVPLWARRFPKATKHLKKNKNKKLSGCVSICFLGFFEFFKIKKKSFIKWVLNVKVGFTSWLRQFGRNVERNKWALAFFDCNLLFTFICQIFFYCFLPFFCFPDFLFVLYFVYFFIEFLF